MRMSRAQLEAPSFLTENVGDRDVNITERTASKIRKPSSARALCPCVCYLARQAVHVFRV